jgi:hypothetical protein
MKKIYKTLSSSSRTILFGAAYNMLRSFTAKLFCCFALLLLCGSTLFAQGIWCPFDPFLDPNIDPYLEHRIVNFRFDPNYPTTYGTGFGAIIFDIEIKASNNYVTSPYKFNSADIYIPVTNTSGATLDLWHGMVNTTGTAWGVTNDPGLQNAIISMIDPFSWAFPQGGILISLWGQAIPPVFTNNFLNLATFYIPVNGGIPDASNFTMQVDFGDNEGSQQFSNWSSTHAMASGYRNCGFAFKPNQDCPTLVYHVGIDPWATANIPSGYQNPICINDLPKSLPSYIINTNNTDPTGNYFYLDTIKGSWKRGGSTVSSVTQAGKYSFEPLYYPNAYCDFQLEFNVDVFDPDNYVISPQGICEGKTVDLTSMITPQAGTTIGNYDFYICTGGNCGTTTPVLITNPTNILGLTSTPTFKHDYFVRYDDGSGCVGTFRQIVFSIKDNPEAATVNFLCDPITGNITTINITNANLEQYSIDNINFYDQVTFETTLTFNQPSYTIYTLNTANGCVVETYISCQICDPISIGTIKVETEPTCGNADGEIQFYAFSEDASSVIMYNVYKNGVLFLADEDYSTTNGLIENLTSGTYTIRVWDDANPQCDTALSHDITLYNKASDLYLKVTPENAANCSSTDGALYIVTTGGTPPFTYTLNGTGVSPIGGKIGGLAAGEYIVEVTDNNNCTTSSGIVRINSTADVNAFSIGISNIVHAQCRAVLGSADFTIAGNSPYFYQLNYLPAVPATNGTFALGDLLPGEHVLRLFNDCGEFEHRFTIENDIPVPFSVTIEKENALQHCDIYTQGKITFNISGPGSPFYYDIDGSFPPSIPVVSGQTVSLPEGTYSIRVMDDAGCTVDINDITISRKTAPSVAIGTLQVIVPVGSCGEQNGNIFFEVNGGSGSYMYDVYKNGVIHFANQNYTTTNGYITGLDAGTYYVEVWDAAHTCNKAVSNSVTLVETINTLTFNVTPTNATNCVSTDGELFIETSGGNPPYTYTLNGAPATVTAGKISNLTAGEYIVAVKDSRIPGCNASQIVRINATTQTNTFTIVGLDSVHTVCGVSNGLFRASITGTLPYQYKLNYETPITATSTTETVIFSDLPAGTHTIHVFGPCGETSYKFEIENTNSNGLNFSATLTNVVEYCNNIADKGSITLTATGGTGQLQYKINDDGWTNFSSPASIAPLDAGTYYVRVKDAANCTYEVNDIVIIREKSAPVSVGTLQAKAHPTSCGATNGTIFFEASGGSGAYEYTVYKNGIVLAPAGRTYNNPGANITGLGAGTYHIEVWDAAHNCNLATSNSVILIEIAGPLTLDVIAKDATTCSSTDGELYIDVTGGTAPYTFTLNGITTIITGGKTGGLTAGEYVVAVIDQGACSASSGTIRINAANPTNTFTIVGLDTVHTVCGVANGLISASIIGSLPYQYQLNYESPITAVSATEIVMFSGLSAGEHFIYAFGPCGDAYFRFKIENTNPNDLSATVVSKNVMEFCDYTATLGSITLTATGGTGQLQYRINDGGWTNFNSPVSIAPLDAGTYYVRVKDAANCTYEVNDVVIIREKSAPVMLGTLKVDAHPAACGSNSGVISFEASGGSGTYVFDLYKNGVKILTDEPYNVLGNYGGLGAGTYYIVLKDAAHVCNFATSNSVTLVETSSNLTINVTAKDASTCSSTDGELYIEVSGGTGTYTFNVSPTGTVVSNKVTGLTAGEYIVSVFDGSFPNACNASSGVIRINSLDDIITIIGLDTVHTVCSASDGIIRATITGTLPYDYRLNYGPVIAATSAVQNVMFTDLSAGEYVIHAFNNCGEGFFNFTIKNTDTNGLSANATAKNVTEFCNNTTSTGSITLTATGGTGQLQYKIDAGIWTNFGTTVTISPLSEGTYYIRVRDAAGCNYEINDVTIIREESAPITVGTLQTIAHPTSCGATNGEIFFEINGGNGTYQYQVYKNGLAYGAVQTYTNGKIENLGAGTYHIRVWDNGYSCNFAISNTVSLIEATNNLTISVSANTTSTCVSSDGILFIEVIGGTNPYTFTLNGAPITVINGKITGLTAGEYVVAVTSAGCSASSGVVRINTDNGSGVFTFTNLTTVHTICGASTGLISVSITGTLPYQYQLNYGTPITATTATEIVTFSGLSAGDHFIRAFSQCGENFYPFTINNANPNGLKFTATPVDVIEFCNNVIENGSIDLVATGGTGQLQYQINDEGWITFTSPETITPLEEGTYLIRVKDATNCHYEVNNIIINRVASVPVTVGTLQATIHPSSCGSNNGEIFFEVNGGSGTYTYDVFKNNAVYLTNQTYTNGRIYGLGAGTYYVVVKDNNHNCNFATSNSVALVEITNAIAINVSKKDASTCSSTDGELYIEITGGTPPYSFMLNGAAITVTDNKIGGLTAGEYVVSVTDNSTNKCNASSGTIKINANDASGKFTIVRTDIVHTVCGASNGIIRATITGVLPYKYQLNYGEEIAATTAVTNVLFTDLTAGNHFIRAFSDCGEEFYEFTIDNANTNGLKFTVVPKHVIEYCDAVTPGSLAITVTGGQTPYSYSIDGSVWTSPIPASITLMEGTYFIRVKDDVGCIYEINNTTILRVKDAPVIVGTLQINIYPTICGSTAGEIFFEVSGGSGVYKYDLFKDGVIYRAAQTYNSNGKITGLGAGTYYVKIWDDAHVCNFATSNSITLDEANGNVNIKVVAEDASDCTTPDGALYIEVSGITGTPLYFLNGTPVTITGGKLNLPAGEYIVTVANAGCTASSGVIRINSAETTDTFTISSLDVVNTICGKSNGIIRASITGVLPYSYQLNYGAIIAATSATETVVFSGLVAGEHLLHIFGICGEDYYRFEVKNNDANALAFTVDAKNVQEYCDGTSPGFLTLTVTGGNGALQYQINDEGWKSCATLQTITVKEGTYYIRVKDASGCFYEINGITVVKERANDPVSLGTIHTTVNPSCNLFDGEVKFYIQGGSGSYEYLLYQNGTQITPTYIPTGSPCVISTLGAGTYRISVRDINHICDVAKSQDFVLDNEDALLAFSVTPNIAGTCVSTDGTLDILVTEGIPVLYTLYNAVGGTLQTNAGTPAGHQFTGLTAGVYIVELRDAAGCIINSGEVRISADETQSGLLLSILDEIPTSDCNINDGAVRFFVDGNSPYYYQINSDEIVTANSPRTVIITGLAAGNHFLRVFNSCGELIEPFTIGNKNSTLSVVATKKDVAIDCDGNYAHGYIALEVTGSFPSFKYTFTNFAGIQTFGTATGTDTINNLTEGIYVVVVTDANGCSFTTNEIEIRRRLSCKVELGLKLFLQGVVQPPGPTVLGDRYRDDAGVENPTIPWMRYLLQSMLPIYQSFMPNPILPKVNPYNNPAFIPGVTVPGSYAAIHDTLGIAGKVVDWILVEIWANFSALGPLTYYDLLDAKALLLKPDGSVVDTNGQKAKFVSYPNGNVRIIVRHRNHLAVMTPEIPFMANFDYDFSTAITKADKTIYTAVTPMVMKHGVACLWAGDINYLPDNYINNSDISIFTNDVNDMTLYGKYLKSDVTMDGLIDHADGSFILYNAKLVFPSPIYYFRKR